MMILLDTNVLSAMMQPVPDMIVAKWLDVQPSDSIWITSVTVMEVRFGLLTMPQGRRAAVLARTFATLLQEIIRGRVAAFDGDAAEQAAEVMARRKVLGRPVDQRDTMIAGIALATRASIATRNRSHFADLAVSLVNPWRA